MLPLSEGGSCLGCKRPPGWMLLEQKKNSQPAWVHSDRSLARDGPRPVTLPRCCCLLLQRGAQHGACRPAGPTEDPQSQQARVRCQPSQQLRLWPHFWALEIPRAGPATAFPLKVCPNRLRHSLASSSAACVTPRLGICRSCRQLLLARGALSWFCLQAAGLGSRPLAVQYTLKEWAGRCLQISSTMILNTGGGSQQGLRDPQNHGGHPLGLVPRSLELKKLPSA